MIHSQSNRLTNADVTRTCAVPVALELARACVLALEHERAKLSTPRTGYKEAIDFFIEHGHRALELARDLEAQMRRHHQLQQQRIHCKVEAVRTARDFALSAVSCLSDCLATADASDKEGLKKQQRSLLEGWRLLLESAGNLKTETLDAETVALVQDFASLSRNWSDEILAILNDIEQGKIICAAEREKFEHKMVFKALEQEMGVNNRQAGMGNHWYVSLSLPPSFPSLPFLLSLSRREVGLRMYFTHTLT
jgi:hypothetical protein